jgi:hypothetical protein
MSRYNMKCQCRCHDCCVPFDEACEECTENHEEVAVALTVNMLEPGDELVMLGETGTVIIVHTPHPLFAGQGLALVIWWLNDRRMWSFDALRPDQELPGVIQPASGGVKKDRLRAILMNDEIMRLR